MRSMMAKSLDVPNGERALHWAAAIERQGRSNVRDSLGCCARNQSSEFHQPEEASMLSTRRLRGLRLPLLLAVSGILAYAGWSLNREPVPKLWKTTPSDLEGWYSMQERIQSATRRVMPAVVAVKLAVADTSSWETRSGTEPYASGVIITKDGIILSQFHVSHRLKWKPGEPYRSRQPGERTMVILSNGRKIEAELLGADATFDLSLLRLLEPGPYPHAALDPSV